MSGVLLVTGTPGVGKSTIAAGLAQQLHRSAHVRADTLQRMIVNGGEWPSAGTPAAHRQLLLRTINAAQVARNLAHENFDVVLDEVVALDTQLEALQRELADVHLRCIVLTASPASVQQRDRDRHKHTAAAYPAVAQQITPLFRARAHFIDSTHLTPEQTIDQVQRIIPEMQWLPCSER